VSKELFMRLIPVALALAVAAGTMASAGESQRPDDQIDPRSQSVTHQGQTALTAGRTNEAIDAFETALVVDPRNREAYMGLARAALAQRLPGKAVRFYGDALQIDPNDLAALEGQGEAYVQRGAVERARRNLTRVQQLCGTNACPQATQLTAVIQRGPPVTTAETSPAPAPPNQAPRQPN
jgi:Flp pilus assembly protein TadD